MPAHDVPANLQRITRPAQTAGHFVVGLGFFLSSAIAETATYSMAPGDSWSARISQLQPGDTLILRDGTYSPVTIDCNANARNGTAAAPITVRAERERQAHLQGDGSAIVLYITGCSYWTFEGLYVTSADRPPEYDYNNVRVYQSDHLTFRRMLVAYNNRYHNASIFFIWYSNHVLVEESEFYAYHRNGLGGNNSDSITLRRNYLNSRGYADLPDGRYSGDPNRGDSGVIVYPMSNVVVENTISEGQSVGFDIEGAYGPPKNNRYYGNISLNDAYGWYATSREPGIAHMTEDTTIEHQVIVEPATVGLYARSTKNTRCTHCTLLGSSSAVVGFDADKPQASEGDGGCAGDCVPSAYAENTLVTNFTRGAGFYFESQADWAVSYSNAYDNSPNYSPYSFNVTNSLSIDPQLGSCKVWIPDASPMKRAGKNGADIGANVLYRYQDGMLTNEPLWDPVTGRFPCGVIVPGVNDVAGSSCFDVHQRLNVNTNGCPFPAGYAQRGLRGDLNGDGKRDLADVRLLIYMLLGQEPKTPEADLTGDGAVTLADVQALIRLMVGIS